MGAKAAESSLVRRSFLARLAVGLGVAGVSLVNSPAAAAQTAPDMPWRPARHVQDDWLEKVPGVHRFVFDVTTPDGMALALQFAGNYYLANQLDYGLKDNDLAVVLVARHKATSFAYNDTIWAKYGKQLSELSEFTDPKTKAPPSVNFYTAAGDGPGQSGRMAALITKGVQFAVCRMATQGIVGKIADETGAKADNVMREIAANLIPNARLVSAGIVAVNRAQERGYSFV